jgi:hypothetical protein
MVVNLQNVVAGRARGTGGNALHELRLATNECMAI